MGTLSPPFSPSIFSYTLSLPYHGSILSFNHTCVASSCTPVSSIGGRPTGVIGRNLTLNYEARNLVSVSVGSTSGVSTTTTYSIDVARRAPPTVTGIVPATGPSIGGTDIEVQGERFLDYPILNVVLNGVACERTRVIDDVSAVCTVGKVNLTADARGNVSSSFDLFNTSKPGSVLQYTYTAPKPPVWNYFPVVVAPGARPVVIKVQGGKNNMRKN